MANMKIYDLPVIHDLNFDDDNDLPIFGGLDGGIGRDFPVLVQYAVKSMQFVLLAYAIDSVSYLATSFNNNYW
ncbi:hypothetical protein H6F32_06375 [Anabaena sp. FACHB-1237]|uniref:hypothetical protein n=1 Tax=Anabaena sp. FACHB-1237 TaxID=2692769 RepID=UPI00168113CA|nr:hypothetical protein [Anabaena sp. FACHB-1237]MBD2137218.1 hypothetical protein [Anabaena sp. FACHB-1237]